MSDLLDLGEMTDLLVRLAGVNSFSHHLEGLAEVAGVLRGELEGLSPDRVEVVGGLPGARSVDERGGGVEEPVGAAVIASKRMDAPVRVLLMIHYDTVYPPGHSFRRVERVDEGTLRGPGVADAKGGIVVLLNALKLLEASAEAGGVGWTVLLNPDEEIGSPGSAGLIAEAARGHQLGMVFEPAPTRETMVTRRKGSGNFSVVFRGRASHAGREIEKGRNAVVAAARLAVGLQGIPSVVPEATVNVAKIDGGGPANVVPDLAVLRFNVRANTPGQRAEVEARLGELVGRCNGDGISAELHGVFSSPPWVMTAENERVFDALLGCGRELRLELRAASSGGASDANKLAAHGLMVLDSLGPVGHSIHSEEERVEVGTLAERARLSGLFLRKVARGEIELRG